MGTHHDVESGRYGERRVESPAATAKKKDAPGRSPISSTLDDDDAAARESEDDGSSAAPPMGWKGLEDQSGGEGGNTFFTSSL